MVGLMPQLKPEEMVVTFEGLLNSSFPRELKSMLDVLAEGLGEPVDVEFAHDGEFLYMLQCRALSQGSSYRREPIPSDVVDRNRIFTADRFVQTGQFRNLEYLVLVDPQDYEKLASRQQILAVARTVGKLNRRLPQRRFALMGPGRWGSRGDIRLGVPVTYADICYTALLIEIARQKGSYVPDVSFGTHFFNDLVEAGIGYLPLYPDDRDTVWNEDFLRGSENALAELVPDEAESADTVRVIHVPAVTDGLLAHIVMDGETDRALGYLAPPTE